MSVSGAKTTSDTFMMMLLMMMMMRRRRNGGDAATRHVRISPYLYGAIRPDGNLRYRDRSATLALKPTLIKGWD